MALQDAGDLRPVLAQVVFAILWEQRRERRFLYQRVALGLREASIKTARAFARGYPHTSAVFFWGGRGRSTKNGGVEFQDTLPSKTPLSHNKNCETAIRAHRNGARQQPRAKIVHKHGACGGVI